MATSVLGRFGHAGFLRENVTSSLVLGAARLLRRSGGLSTSGAQALTAAVEALVPSAVGIIDVPAVTRRAQQHLYTLRPEDRRDLCAFLDLLEHAIPITSGRGLRFSRLSLSARMRCLSTCERSSLQILSTGYAALRHLALVAFMEAPEAWPASAAE